MDREIKFRAWNKSQSKMFDWEGIRDAKEEHIWSWLHLQKTEEHNVLLQFTGLKDKNGKEIYEADIIRSYSTIGEEIIHKMEWSDEIARFCCIHPKYGQNGGIMQSWINEFKKEVIGNIYETPELFE